MTGTSFHSDLALTRPLFWPSSAHVHVSNYLCITIRRTDLLKLVYDFENLDVDMDVDCCSKLPLK